MLENYLEKNIFRQVYLCEQLYENRTIHIHELAEQLQVSSITITNDLEAIIEGLAQHIVTSTKGRNSCTVTFDPSCSCLSVTQTIYRRSYFLRILGLYLAGERNWGNMAQAAYISLSKVYHLRSGLRTFFADLDYLQEDGTIQIPEKDYRYLLLSVVRCTNQTDLVQINQPISQAGRQLIDYVEGHFFSRSYPMEEKQLILLGIAIGLQRAKTNPICFTEEEKAEARRTPLFQLIEQGLQQLSFSLCHNENEQFYLYSLFNARNYLCNNLELLQKDFDVVYQNHVQANPLKVQLSQRLITALRLSDRQQLLFEKAFLPFIRSTWADMQLFQPEKMYLLTGQQQPLYTMLRQLLDQWKQDNNLTLRWNDNLIRRLTINLALLHQQPPQKKIEVFIVAPSDFKFLYYHQQLEALLGEPFSISSMICNHLNEVVDDTFFCTKRVILCDSSLYQENLGSDNTIIYSINCHTIDEVITQLNQQVHFLTESPQRYIF